ncbi:hypothetical protein TgHK011_006289 [Trichoderma gracile]|nr:hypothetical protein TgHK011_006289 [Trichoderma gracile]
MEVACTVLVLALAPSVPAPVLSNLFPLPTDQELPSPGLGHQSFSSSKSQFTANRRTSLAKAQHCHGQPAARAAAREALQDETRLERRCGGDEALLETRAAVIGGVRARRTLARRQSTVPAESRL